MTERAVSCIQQEHKSIPLFQRLAHAACKALVVLVLHNQLIYDNFNIMVLIPIDFHSFFQLHYLAVHAYVEKTFAAYGVEKLFIVSLTVAHQRSKQIYLMTDVITQNKAEDLLLCILHHPLTGDV